MRTLKIRVLSHGDININRKNNNPIPDAMCIYDKTGKPVPVRWSKVSGMLVQNPLDENTAWFDIVLDDVKFDLHHDGGFGQPDIEDVVDALASGRMSIATHDRESGAPVGPLLVTAMTLLVSARLAYEIPVEQPFHTQPMPSSEKSDNETTLGLMLAAAMRAYTAKNRPDTLFVNYAATWLDWRGVKADGFSGKSHPRKPVYAYCRDEAETVRILTDCTLAEFASDVLKNHANGAVFVESLFGEPLASMKFRNGAVFSGFNPCMPRAAVNKDTLAVLDTILEAGTGLVTVRTGSSGADYTVKISIPANYGKA